MANNFVLEDSLPIVLLKIVALESCKDLAAKVNGHIVQFKCNDIEELMRRREDLHYRGYSMDSYLLHCGYPRSRTGEGKAVVSEFVRGTDVFAMVGVMNYSIPYTVSGYTNRTSPGDHFQDLKRITGACSATAHRVNVVTPFLHKSRQHKRSKRESLDCVIALEGLAALGVENIIIFDAHDPRAQNAIPPIGFDNFMPTYQPVKALFSHDSNIRIDKEHLIVISSDEDAMNRAVYLVNNLGVDMGMFYKRRDYSQVTGGRNPTAAYGFLGSSAEGKTVFIIDNMMSSGESMLGTCKELKEHKADKVIAYCTFGSLINGLEKFDEYYHRGYLDCVTTTNLNYCTQELINREWYLKADMSKYLAAVTNSMNRDRSISVSLSPTEKVQKLAQKRQSGGYEYSQKPV